MVMFSLLTLGIYLPSEVSAQHHGAPPPAASIGDRKISLNFESQTIPMTKGQDIEMKISFMDENAKKKINHVTFRMEISKDGNRLLSEFFHSHEGEVNLSFRDSDRITSSPNYTIGATLDVLTNAWVADPGSPIMVRGGEIFSQPGAHKAIIEVTTMDNDKTDLSQPIRYEISIQVS